MTQKSFWLKRFKTLLTVSLALFVLISTTACLGGKETTDQDADSQTTETTDTESGDEDSSQENTDEPGDTAGTSVEEIDAELEIMEQDMSGISDDDFASEELSDTELSVE